MSILGNVAGLAAVQPDWAQTDEQAADFIRNKPELAQLGQDLARALELGEGALLRSGGTMEGDLSLGGNRLTDLPEPQEGSDPATKAYVDAAGSSQLYLEVTLTPEGWTGESGGPYTQRVYCAGIGEEDRPHYGLLYSGAREERLLQKESWAMVDDLETETDYLTFTCLEDKPTASLTVQLEVHRSGETAETAALLTLEEDAQWAVQAEVDAVSYGVTNASVNGEPEGQKYDFTVL